MLSKNSYYDIILFNKNDNKTIKYKEICAKVPISLTPKNTSQEI